MSSTLQNWCGARVRTSTVADGGRVYLVATAWVLPNLYLPPIWPPAKPVALPQFSTGVGLGDNDTLLNAGLYATWDFYPRAGTTVSHARAGNVTQ